MDDNDLPPSNDGDVFQTQTPMGLVREKITLLEGNMARGCILNYLVRIQIAVYRTNHLK
jgi:hypothetical protein